MERNVTLDYFKIFFSILLITAHIYYPYQAGKFYIGWYIPEGIARIGVPFFFLVNGYYFAKKINDYKAIKKYLGHLFIIYTTWFIIYLRPFIYRTEEFYIIDDLRIDVLLEKYFWGIFHLWYLPALITGIILLVLCKKLIKKNLPIVIISIFLYIIGYILEPMRTDLSNFRNGLFIGFPFIAIGYCLRSIDFKNIKDLHLITLSLLLLVFLIFESTLAQKVGFKRDIYIPLIFLCPALFILIQKHSTFKLSSKYYDYIGNLSSAIYFSHMYIIFKSNTIFKDISIIERFLIVSFISVLVSFLIVFLNKRIKIFL